MAAGAAPRKGPKVGAKPAAGGAVKAAKTTNTGRSAAGRVPLGPAALPPMPPTTRPIPQHVLAKLETVDMGPPRIRFSFEEVVHLAASVVILSYALSIVLGPKTFPARLVPDPVVLVATTISVSTGFLLHELAHKVAAHRFGFWAEFRAEFLNLLLSLGLAVAPLGFLVAFPGAVRIFGRATPQEAGRIALVGPLVNLVLAGITVPWLLSVHEDGPLRTILVTVGFTNAILGVFNLLPFGAFDGRKVVRWNGWVYALAVAVAVGLLVTILSVVVSTGALDGT